MREPLLLLPAPRRLDLSGGEYSLDRERLILIQAEPPQALLFTAQRLQRALQEHWGPGWEISAGGAVPAGQVDLRLQLDPSLQLPAQGYELVVSAGGATIRSPDPAGIFYGACTLIQIIEQASAEGDPALPCLEIGDWPDFQARGVMLDVSRNRVPTMETLFNLVDRLAGWKINQIQLYFEHTFAYRQHPEVWAGVSPFSGQDILELDRYCRERFIELVPNQQSFGHLAPWLNHPAYKHLAEVETGFQTPWGYREGSFSLCPVDPRSLAFLRGLYAELLPHFTSRMFNVGGDETWDLGQGRSRQACEEQGNGRVYLNFLLQIFEEVRRYGRTPQFWGDIIVEHPELIPELPKDVIAVEWGYEADHPFDQHGAQFASSGIPFYVCPGTSSWCSLAGRTDNAVKNLLNAAENGLKHGASGYLITDWGDYGHWQAWSVSLLGLMFGAACSWALEANRELDLPAQLSWHGFRDPSGALGRAAYDLGNVYRSLWEEPHNSSVLFWCMQWPLEKIRACPEAAPAHFERALQAIDQAAQPLYRVKTTGQEADQVQEEFDLTLRMLRHACRRGLLALETDPRKAHNLRRELATDLAALIPEYRWVWLGKNREGGLSESAARLEKLRADYVD